MTAPQLCPSALNELGKGIFPPAYEARLLAQGYVFACRLPGTNALLRGKRPIAEAANDMAADTFDARSSTHIPIPVTS